jgi:hypothetical protein
MTLKEKVENEIKRLEEAKNMNELRKEGVIDYLQWVLSELEKMTCQNCKYVSNCNKRETWIETNEDIKKIDDIIFCSLWDEK